MDMDMRTVEGTRVFRSRSSSSHPEKPTRVKIILQWTLPRVHAGRSGPDVDTGAGGDKSRSEDRKKGGKTKIVKAANEMVVVVATFSDIGWRMSRTRPPELCRPFYEGLWGEPNEAR